ncbi:nitrile hydratase accessory protein [Rhodoplanes azumiensis]|uniref:Nitrile hydratase accessory protein n=1 Tax=Rhodoplanes azumiensis TaxID=1897628 RepID=A0ABW5ARY2_9BRAD
MLSDHELRVRAVATLVTERGGVEADVLDSFVDVYVARVVPHPDAPVPPPDDDTMTDAALGAKAMTAIPRDAEGPLFADRWEALAFVLTMLMEQRGVFTWLDWAQALGTEIRGARKAGRDDGYFESWLAALERVARDKGIADRATLDQYRQAWNRAAARTAPGDEIMLRAEDFG